jgi:cytochrome P450
MQEPGHREFRNLLAPAFTYEAINGRFLPEIAAIVGRTLERWEGAGAPVKAYDAFKRMTFEIIMNVGAAVRCTHLSTVARGPRGEAGRGWVGVLALPCARHRACYSCPPAKSPANA